MQPASEGRCTKLHRYFQTAGRRCTRPHPLREVGNRRAELVCTETHSPAATEYAFSADFASSAAPQQPPAGPPPSLARHEAAKLANELCPLVLEAGKEGSVVRCVHSTAATQALTVQGERRRRLALIVGLEVQARQHARLVLIQHKGQVHALYQVRRRLVVLQETRTSASSAHAQARCKPEHAQHSRIGKRLQHQHVRRHWRTPCGRWPAAPSWPLRPLLVAPRQRRSHAGSSSLTSAAAQPGGLKMQTAVSPAKDLQTCKQRVSRSCKAVASRNTQVLSKALNTKRPTHKHERVESAAEVKVPSNRRRWPAGTGAGCGSANERRAKYGNKSSYSAKRAVFCLSCLCCVQVWSGSARGGHLWVAGSIGLEPTCESSYKCGM